MHFAPRPLPNLTIILIVTGGLILSALTCTIAYGQESGSASKTEDVRAVVSAMLETQTAAWNKADLEGFMQHYWNSPNLTFSAGGKTTRGWQATLDRYKKSYDTPEKMGQLTFSELEFINVDSNALLVLGQWRLKRESDEPHGNFSLVLKRIENQWKIIHDHSSTLKEPTEDDQ